MEKTVATKNEEEMRSAVIIERTPEYLEASKQLGAFIKSLPLDELTAHRLVELTVEQTKAAEHGALLQGFRMGLEYAFERNGARWTEGIRILEKLREQLNKSGTGQVQKTDDIYSE